MDKALGNGLTVEQIVAVIADADTRGDTRRMSEIVRQLTGPEHRLVANEFRERQLGIEHKFSGSWRSKEELLSHIEKDHRRKWQLPRITLTRGFLVGFHRTVHGVK